jgi:hypothetical protein
MKSALLKRTAWVLLLAGSLAPAGEKPAPRMLAHLRADGDYTKDPKSVVKADVKLAPKKDGALLLSGKYAPGELVTEFQLHVPRLDYGSFTVVVRVKPDDTGKGRMAIVYGGEASRWIGLDRFGVNGQLSVVLNNGGFQRLVKVMVKGGEWVTVALALDLKGKRVIVAAGGTAEEVSLPDGFRLEEQGSAAERQEKTFLFTDFSTGTCLSGLVEEMTVYDRAMSRAEMEKATRGKGSK